MQFRVISKFKWQSRVYEPGSIVECDQVKGDMFIKDGLAELFHVEQSAPIIKDSVSVESDDGDIEVPAPVKSKKAKTKKKKKK